MESIKHTYIAIEGVIGAGKSTLAKKLGTQLSASLIFEEFEENPFLPLFYKEPERYAFQVEMSFLAARFHQLHGKISQQDLFNPLYIADYWFDKCLLFAKNNLKGAEYDLFSNLFNIMKSQLPQPSLVLYLHLPTELALARIAQRGREYEQNISASYLNTLSEQYLTHLKSRQNQTTLIVETERLDILNKNKDLELIIDLLQQKHSTGITRITF